MKKLNFIGTILCLSALLFGCESTDQSNSTEASEGELAFEKNSKTVLAYLDAWQQEGIDYDQFFASDYWTVGMAYGETDTIKLEQMIELDQRLFNTFDFKIVTEPINLLPGVNVDTKMIDGSVRHYSEWKITKTATDSTDSKSGNLSMYETYEFNDKGKITSSVTYGDFGGLLSYLNSEE